jgi:hypothetical protein
MTGNQNADNLYFSTTYFSVGQHTLTLTRQSRCYFVLGANSENADLRINGVSGTSTANASKMGCERAFFWLLDSSLITMTISSDAPFRIAFAPTATEYIVSNIMLTEGTISPDHYIPHRYTSDIPIYIGSSQLGEEEYVDYGEQKVYKRTENLWDKDNIEAFIDPATGTSIDRVVCHITAGTYSILNGTSRNIYYVKASNDTQLACAPNSSTTLIAEEIETGYPFLYLQGVDPQNGDITVITGSTIPAQHIPYLQPTDPPVPLPSISTYKGENTISSTEAINKIQFNWTVMEIASAKLPNNIYYDFKDT